MRSIGLLLMLSVASSSSGVAQETSAETQIRLVRSRSNDAIARHDVVGIVAALEEDFRITTSSGVTLEGRDAMGEAFATRFEQFADVRYLRTAEAIEVDARGRVAAETGTWDGSWTDVGGPVRTGGRYLAYWRKGEAGWRVFAELYVPLFREEGGPVPPSGGP